MIRIGILSNPSTWTIIARILCKNGKLENVARILDSGISNADIFDLVIDGYSRIGNFEAAIDLVNEMCERNLIPGLFTYGFILDGACQFSNKNMVDTILCAMKEKKLLPENVSFGYDDVIKKFCDIGKSFAAELLFKKAHNEGVRLEDATFGYVLGAFCKGGRVEEAIGLYKMIIKEKIVIEKSYYQELAESICNGNPSETANYLLRSLIIKGFGPSESSISKFMMKLCGKENWKEVEALLNVMLQFGILPDSPCCRLLVKHFCSSGEIDSALLLHQKFEKLRRVWDVKSYNILLRKLVTEVRVDEALEVFESMKRNKVVNRASFLVMISGLSQRKHMRMAMQVHDEMLKLRLKPSSKTYKSLISVFR